jgi:organic radical activating enzyme
MKLAVSEVFYSIQGEGMTTGFPAVFVRLAGCNLMCGGKGTEKDGKLHDGATWRCDSIEVWIKGKSKSYEDILPIECQEAIRNGAHVIITGGEPMLQQKNIVGFIKYIQSNLNYDVFTEIETNGTIMPSEEMLGLIDQWNVSPKLANSGMPKEDRINASVLQELNNHNCQFKFVVSSGKDWEEIKQDYLPHLFRSYITLMPAGSNQEELKETKEVVAEICKENYLRLTNRLHIDIWNKKTGV